MVNGRQPFGVHPLGAGVLRPDIDGSGEGHQRELHRLGDLLDLRGLQGQRVDELLGGRLEQRHALLAGPSAVLVHRGRVVEHKRDLERVLEADVGLGREGNLLVALLRWLAEQAEEGGQEIRLVVQHRRHLQCAAAELVVGQDDGQLGIGRVYRPKVGLEELVRISDHGLVGRAAGHLASGCQAGRIKRIDGRLLLPVHLAEIDGNGHAAHDRQHDYSHQHRVVAAPIPQEVEYHCWRPPPRLRNAAVIRRCEGWRARRRFP